MENENEYVPYTEEELENRKSYLESGFLLENQLNKSDLTKCKSCGLSLDRKHFKNERSYKMSQLQHMCQLCLMDLFQYPGGCELENPFEKPKKRS